VLVKLENSKHSLYCNKHIPLAFYPVVRALDRNQLEYTCLVPYAHPWFDINILNKDKRVKRYQVFAIIFCGVSSFTFMYRVSCSMLSSLGPSDCDTNQYLLSGKEIIEYIWALSTICSFQQH